uniref:TrmH family RNA methyltransferase n=1 Tax=Salmonella enterica TaxID=28901 RepID=UPI00398C4D48
MLDRRQTDLTICMEQGHKPHNVSPIIRTADAVRVHEVHATWPGSRMGTRASAAACIKSWLQGKTHSTFVGALAQLKRPALTIRPTHLSNKSCAHRQTSH